MMRIAIYFILLTCSSVALPQQASLKDESVIKEVQKLGDILSDGVADLRDATLIKYSDLPIKDEFEPQSTAKFPAAVVLFTITAFGGGNNAHDFLAVYEEEGNHEEHHPEWLWNYWRLVGFTSVRPMPALNTYRVFQHIARKREMCNTRIYFISCRSSGDRLRII